MVLRVLGANTTQRLGSSTKRFFASGSSSLSVDQSRRPWLPGAPARPCSLVCPGQFYYVTRGLLHLLARSLHLGTLLFIGRG